MAINFDKLPKREYVKQVTAIELLPRLTAALGGPEIYMKRDDALPLAAGGNKTRKLDYAIGDAMSKGADTVITAGAIQSNHCRLTAAACAKEGLDCHLVLEERVPGTYNTEATGNNFLYKLLGVKSIKVVPKGTPVMAEMEKLAEDLKKQGKKTYVLPGGASYEAGVVGYAACGQEIVQQMKQMGLHFDAIITPSGSGGTHAGLMTGLLANNCKIPVQGFCVNKPSAAEETLVYELAQKCVKKLGLSNGVVPRDAIKCDETQIGPGYSLPTKEMIEAITILAQTEGILMDPVYSGKVMAGLISFVRQGKYKKGEKVLFLHTGGSPALFAYQDYFKHLQVPTMNTLKK